MTEILIAVMGLAMGFTVGYAYGWRRGRAAEALRIDLIFYAATDYVIGGVHNILWDRIRDRNTDEQFHARLVGYVKNKKEQARK